MISDIYRNDYNVVVETDLLHKLHIFKLKIINTSLYFSVNPTIDCLDSVNHAFVNFFDKDYSRNVQ